MRNTNWYGITVSRSGGAWWLSCNACGGDVQYTARPTAAQIAEFARRHQGHK